MGKNKKIEKVVDFQKDFTERFKNPKFKKYFNEYGKQLEIVYEVIDFTKIKKSGVNIKNILCRI